jgi:ubiquinone/menaquinone biosynthesis C-methylase UbiE
MSAPIRQNDTGIQSDLIFPGSQINRHAYLLHLSRYVFVSPFCYGKNVLEIGCGTGYGSSFLREKGAEKVIGIDIDKRAIDIARSYFRKPRLEFICGDMEGLPFRDNSFQVVISFGSLDHVEDAKMTLSECKRVLCEGGTFIVSLVTREFITLPLFNHPLDPFHQKEFNCDELTRLVKVYFPRLELFGQRYYSKPWWWTYMILREFVYKKLPFTQPILTKGVRVFFPGSFQSVTYDERAALVDNELDGKFQELLTDKEKHSAVSIMVTAVKLGKTQ